jgi:16S rRNA (cytosine1402-N4)-methyltransferase
MTGSDSHAVAGGLARHIPVLARQVFEQLSPHQGLYIDGTFGAGGHTRAILQVDGTEVIGIDRDRDAIAGGFALVDSFGGRLTLVEDRFSNLEQVAHSLGHEAVDGILLDLGVSSMQLDTPERGFSFRFDGPLDMRMSGEGQSAADLVETLSEVELADVIRTFGEERFARRIARAITAARQREAVRRTAQLAEIVRGAIPASEPGLDPATRTFQALRIAVNDELGELDRGLAVAEQLLAPGGRLAVVSFHSLEDRRVKEFLRRRSGTSPQASRHQPARTGSRAPSFTLLSRRVIRPSATEIAHNPRARAARLRAAERTASPPWPENSERPDPGRHKRRQG